MDAEDDPERIERLREVEPEMAARRRPSSAAEGLAATWSAVNPPASTNSGEDRPECAGIRADDDREATENHQRRARPRIVSTGPIRPLSQAAGKDSRP